MGATARLAVSRRQIQATGSCRSLCRGFCSHAGCLVVEIDGVQHEWQSLYDEARTRTPESAGFHAVRVTNHEVCNDLESVLLKIGGGTAVAVRLSLAKTFTPGPSPERERGVASINTGSDRP